MRSIRHNRPTTAPERWRTLARACEWGFFTLGAICLIGYTAACSHGTFFRFRERAAFERALEASIQNENQDRNDWSEQRLRSYQRPARVPSNALGRLDIPNAAVSVMLLKGTDELTLNTAVGHIEGTALPGESGNVGIAGHRDSFFRGLRHLEVGDDLSLTTLDGIGHYQVAEVKIVEPKDVEVLESTEHETVTLVTCYPFYYVGDAPQRFIVHARQVEFEPWSRRTERD